jgi:hypothetical protein
MIVKTYGGPMTTEQIVQHVGIAINDQKIHHVPSASWLLESGGLLHKVDNTIITRAGWSLQGWKSIERENDLKY